MEEATWRSQLIQLLIKETTASILEAQPTAEHPMEEHLTEEHLMVEHQHQVAMVLDISHLVEALIMEMEVKTLEIMEMVTNSSSN